MLCCKDEISLCHDDTFIYAIGGQDRLGGDMDDCQKYNVAADKWVQLPQLNNRN